MIYVYVFTKGHAPQEKLQDAKHIVSTLTYTHLYSMFNLSHTNICLGECLASPSSGSTTERAGGISDTSTKNAIFYDMLDFDKHFLLWILLDPFCSMQILTFERISSLKNEV